MPLIVSKYRTGLDNGSIDALLVKKIKLVVHNPDKPKLWITYFLGLDENEQEKVVRTWFHQSEQERDTDVARIREKYPEIQII